MENKTKKKETQLIAFLLLTLIFALIFAASFFEGSKMFSLISFSLMLLSFAKTYQSLS